MIFFMSHCEICLVTVVLQRLKNKLATYPLLSVWKMGRPHLHLVTPFLPFLAFPQTSICFFLYQSAFCCCGNIPHVKKEERQLSCFQVVNRCVLPCFTSMTGDVFETMSQNGSLFTPGCLCQIFFHHKRKVSIIFLHTVSLHV